MSPTKSGKPPVTKLDVLEKMFLPRNDEADQKSESEKITLPAPSGRPLQIGLLGYDHPELFSKRDGKHLYPKQAGTKIIDYSLEMDDPILFAKEVCLQINQIDGNFWNDIYSLIDRHKLQPSLFPMAEEMQDERLLKIRRLPSSGNTAEEDNRLLLAFQKTAESVYTYFQWLKSSGYDFVFGGLSIDDIFLDGVTIPGGRNDGIGIRLVQNIDYENAQKKLRELNLWRNNPNRAISIREFLDQLIADIGIENIESIEILEFKLLNEADSHGVNAQRYIRQIQRYTDIVKMSMPENVKISGKLIYFGDFDHQIDAISVSPSKDASWIKLELEEGRRGSKIKLAVSKEKDILMAHMRRAREQDIVLFGELMQISEVKHFYDMPLVNLLVLSHFGGYTIFDDNTILLRFSKESIGLVYDEILIIRSQGNFAEGYHVYCEDGLIVNEDNIDEFIAQGYVFHVVSNEWDGERMSLEFILKTLQLFGRKKD